MASPHVIDCVITHCTAIEGGGGIAAIRSSVLVDDCIVVDNRGGPGGGLMSHNDGGAARPPIFARCIIAGNQAKGGHGGGGVSLDGHATFINCTICDNRTLNDDLYGGGLYCGSGDPDRAILRNCIIWGNTASKGSEIAVLGSVGILGTMFAIVEHSLIGTDPNGILDPQNHIRGQWLQADPLMRRMGYWDTNGTADNPDDDSFVHGDYHVKSQAGRWDPASKNWVRDDVTSPCIDSGDPNSPVCEELFPNGGRINMGAYGGTSEASKSYFGEPVCETIIAGDINGDCKVDFKDLTLMAMNWLGGALHGSGEGPGDQNESPPEKGR